MPRPILRWFSAALLMYIIHPSLGLAANLVQGSFDHQGVAILTVASEPSIAVGPHQVLTQVTGGVAAYSKDGTPVPGYFTPGGGQPYLSPFYFYGISSPTDPNFFVDKNFAGALAARDPIIAFDPLSQRFFALVWSWDHLNITVSKSSDVRDGWFNYHIDITGVSWDRPSMGLSSDKVVLTSWHISSPAEVWVLDKQAMVAGTILQRSHVTYGTHLDIHPDAIRVISTYPLHWDRACVGLSTTSDVYLVDLNDAGGYHFNIARVIGTPGSAIIQPSPPIATWVNYNDGPASVIQPGTPSELYLHGGPQSGPVLLSNPFFRDVPGPTGPVPTITVASFQKKATNAQESELRIWEINASSGAFITDATYAEPGVSYGFPAAITDANGNLYVGFNAVGGNKYASCYVMARKKEESTFGSKLTVQDGDVFSIPTTPITQRWGDFTGIALDECSGGAPTVYVAGQYSNNTQSYSLASWVRSFRYEPAGTPTPCGTDGAWHVMNASTPVSLHKRSGATTTWDPAHNRFIVYGGYNEAYGYLNDVWAYTPASNSWSQLASSPVDRARHTAVYDDRHVPPRIVVFGGENLGGKRNDVWALNLSEPPAWESIYTPGTLPSTRASHIAVYDHVRNQMVIHGGVPQNSALTWKLEFESDPPNQWTQISPSNPPAEYEGGSAIYDPVADCMMVFGGRLYYTASCPSPWLVNSNGTYSLSLSNPTQWTQHTIANPPPARAFAAAVYDPLYKRVIIHGGIQDQVCDGPPTCGALENGLADAYALTLPTAQTPTMRWTSIGGFCYDGPTPRGCHSAVYDVSSNRVYVFGGAEKRAVGSTCPVTENNDVWRLTLPDATAPTAVPNLSPVLGSNDGTINWTAPGDDGSTGIACAYDLRYSNAPITAANFHLATQIPTTAPQGGGSGELAVVTNLEGCSWYSFALKTLDGSGNWSALSNTPKRLTGCFIMGGTDTTSDSQKGAALPVAVDLRLASGHPAQSDLKISYAIPAQGRGSVLNLAVFDLIGRRVHTLIDGKAEPGKHLTTWDLRDRQGARVKNGIYFLKLRVGDEARQQKVMVVE